MSKSRKPTLNTNVDKSPSDHLTSANELLKEYGHQLVIPLTTTALGYSISGLYGAILGFGIGTLDEALYHNGYTEQRYFSSMLIGAGMFVSLEKSLNYNIVAGALGSTLALTLPTGIIEQYPIIIQATENAVIGDNSLNNME